MEKQIETRFLMGRYWEKLMAKRKPMRMETQREKLNERHWERLTGMQTGSQRDSQRGWLTVMQIGILNLMG